MKEWGGEGGKLRNRENSSASKSRYCELYIPVSYETRAHQLIHLHYHQMSLHSTPLSDTIYPLEQSGM